MSDNVSRSDLISAINKSAGVTKIEASAILDSILSAIANGLKEDGEVKIAKFGSFTLKHRAARQARNPKTGEMVDVDAYNTVVFKPAKMLKDAVEGNGSAKAA